MAKTPTLLYALREKRRRLWDQHQSLLYRSLHTLQPEYQALHGNEDWPGDPPLLGFPPGGYDERRRDSPPSGYEWAPSLDIIRGQIQGINYAIFLIGGGFK